MIARAGRAYIQVMLIALVVLLIISAATYLLMFTGQGSFYAKGHELLGRAALILGASSIPFRKKGVGLIAGIKSCPAWMYKSAIVLALYGMIGVIPSLLFATGGILAWPKASFAFLFGFEAIPICILYSALARFHFDEPELVDGAGISVIWMIFGVVWIMH